MALLWARKSVRITIFVERKILLANNEKIIMSPILGPIFNGTTAKEVTDYLKP
jgi:hypothetical protein